MGKLSRAFNAVRGKLMEGDSSYKVRWGAALVGQGIGLGVLAVTAVVAAPVTVPALVGALAVVAGGYGSSLLVSGVKEKRKALEEPIAVENQRPALPPAP